MEISTKKYRILVFKYYQFIEKKVRDSHSILESAILNWNALFSLLLAHCSFTACTEEEEEVSSRQQQQTNKNRWGSVDIITGTTYSKYWYSVHVSKSLKETFPFFDSLQNIWEVHRY